VVGARYRPPKSKINLLSANGYNPSTENGGIIPNATNRCNRRQNFDNGTQNKIYGMFKFLKGFIAFIPH